jgi:peptidyl-prolyl cis-trans isomerase SurA
MGYAFAAERLPLEGVAAVVGGEVILLSEVEQGRQMFATEMRGFAALSDAEQRKTVLDKLIDQKVLLAKAKLDTTIKVNPKDVAARVAEQFAAIAEQQGGEKQLELALRQTTGMSLGQYKSRLQDQMSDGSYIQRLRMKYVGDPEPSHLQVENFYKEYKDSLPVQRNGIKLSHIQVRIQPGVEILKTAKAKADSLIRLLNEGADFSEMAKANSEDGTATSGGDLGYTKRGSLDQDFERAAFSLETGDYTPYPVKTRFGYHIIRATGRKDNEVRSSHILIRTVASSEDSVRTRALADSLKAVAASGSDFPTLAKKFSDDPKTKEVGGLLGWFLRDQLNEDYKAAVDTLAEKGLSEPVQIQDSWHVFRVDQAAEERHLNLEEDYTQIAQMAKEWVASKKLETFLVQWRKSIPIESRIERFTFAPPGALEEEADEVPPTYGPEAPPSGG